MNVCMVGYGMMGVWHTEALPGARAVPHTLVGRRPDAAREFAERYGYRKWTLSLDEALADPEVDVVILSTPSDQHEAQAVQCLAAGKHTLIEIPIAMSLAGAQRVVAAGERSGKVYGVCHPMRFRREWLALRDRLRSGEETLRHVAGRFFIKRLVNVGATGYQRSWTDNILWHHFCHFVDLGMFLWGDAPVRATHGTMAPCHAVTGIPMQCVVVAEGEAGQSLMVHGSYEATHRFYDNLVVTDRETYFLDVLSGTLRTEAHTIPIESEQANCARVTQDFIDAAREGRPPLASGPAVLPAMQVLQNVQDAWDARYGAQDLPGRPLASRA